MKTGWLGKALLGLWIAAGVALLAWWLGNRAVEEAAQAFGWMVILWGLPISLLVSVVFGLVVQIGFADTPGDLQTFLFWTAVALGGLFQWAWVVPRLFRWLVSLRRNKGEVNAAGQPVSRSP
jgi:hypothetical protein